MPDNRSRLAFSPRKSQLSRCLKGHINWRTALGCGRPVLICTQSLPHRKSIQDPVVIAWSTPGDPEPAPAVKTLRTQVINRYLERHLFASCLGVVSLCSIHQARRHAAPSRRRLNVDGDQMRRLLQAPAPLRNNKAGHPAGLLCDDREGRRLRNEVPQYSLGVGDARRKTELVECKRIVKVCLRKASYCNHRF